MGRDRVRLELVGHLHLFFTHSRMMISSVCLQSKTDRLWSNKFHLWQNRIFLCARPISTPPPMAWLGKIEIISAMSFSNVGGVGHTCIPENLNSSL